MKLMPHPPVFDPATPVKRKPNRRERRAHLQRSSNCKRSTRGSRIQAVPLGERYTVRKAGRTTLCAQGFRFIRHHH